ncbi:hypothetical protein H5410_001544 [Solanum commersonii]|uniref:Uncharacterized protein n=1 Tax=Solanum commersonii TaxID=4109 RepID=A0A9J6AZZ3_SOLCO|nr:hypothetical protein H5410_001544 [Solanum commersonii]
MLCGVDHVLKTSLSAKAKGFLNKFGSPHIIFHFHREMAQLPEKVIVVAAPFACETTNTISLTSLHLHRTPSSFFFPPSPTSTNPKTLSRRTSSSLTITDRCEPLGNHMLSILSGIPEGQETPHCLRRTNMLGGSSPPLVYQTILPKKMEERKKGVGQGWMAEKAGGLVEE